jgi:hypothetical protein
VLAKLTFLKSAHLPGPERLDPPPAGPIRPPAAAHQDVRSTEAAGARWVQRAESQDFADGLEAFESENLDWLLNADLDGWNLWHTLKKPLYYRLKNAKRPKKAADGAQGNGSSHWRYWLREAPKYFLDVLRCGLQARGRAVIISDSVNKRGGEDGRYIDIFLDALVTTGAVKEYVYVESSSQFRFCRPSAVEMDINRDGQNLVVAVLRRLNSLRPSVKNAAAALSERLRSFFGDGQVPLNERELTQLLCNFVGQRQWYSLLWKLLRPSRIFIVDGIPDGLMAAARKRTIPVYEFQHGHVVRNKPDYIVRGEFGRCKDKIARPDYIFVFGDYFRDLLLRDGFWSQDEVVSLGSYLVDRARESSQFRPPAPGQSLNVLWATQPSAYTPMQTFLSELETHDLTGIRVTIRAHPMEPEANVAWYRDLASRHPERFVMDDSRDIFAALKGKHLLVSLHSTTLIEALALGYPVVTLGLGRYVRGINDLLEVDVSDVIRPVAGPGELALLLEKLRTDGAALQDWARHSATRGAYFFAEHYLQNVDRLLSRPPR